MVGKAGSKSHYLCHNQAPTSLSQTKPVCEVATGHCSKAFGKQDPFTDDKVNSPGFRSGNFHVTRFFVSLYNTAVAWLPPPGLLITPWIVPEAEFQSIKFSKPVHGFPKSSTRFPHFSSRIVAAANMTSPISDSNLSRKWSYAKARMRFRQNMRGVKAVCKRGWEAFLTIKVPTPFSKRRAKISQPSEYRANPNADGDFSDPKYLVPSRTAPEPCPRRQQVKAVSRWSPDSRGYNPISLASAFSNATSDVSRPEQD